MMNVLVGLVVWLLILWFMWAFLRAMMGWIDEALGDILEGILNRK